KDEEAVIAEALSTCRHKKAKPNFSKLARQYKVSRKKLSRRYIGAPPTNEQICESANYLLSKDFTGLGDPPRARKTWVYNFLKRLERTAAEYYGEIERWFTDLKAVIKELWILPRLLWNFDETGFVVGRGKDEAVVTKHPKNAKRITVVECINAERALIPPLLIPKVRIIWRSGISISKRTIGLLLLLKMDEMTMIGGFPLWIAVQRIFLWSLLNIVKCHLLQSLDGGPFQQYKHIHGRVVNKAARLGGFDFNKNDFFLKNYAISGLRRLQKRGIWPLNPKIILDQMPSPEEAFEAMVARGDILKFTAKWMTLFPAHQLPNLYLRLQLL
ncbi:hypothetical protein DPV78_011808, partial [Talaromyces pinophilus]